MPPLLRILHLGYGQLRRYGNTRVSWTQKLFRGLIQNGHFVHFFSDRDVASFEAPFGWRDLGKKKVGPRLLETAEAVQPDLVVVGHCDLVSNETLEALRAQHRGVRIVHCNNDPLFVPDNVEKIKRRLQCCDRVFVSTGLPTLREYFPGNEAKLRHMPNPVDPAIERFDVSALPSAELENDLLFCGNSDDHTERGETVKWLREQLDPAVRFKTHGYFGEPPVWGLAYDRALSISKMGLNLNRQEGHHWYSSARMAQLGGNGLLVFTDSANSFQDLFPDESLVYYDSKEDLAAKIAEFQSDDDKRRHFASTLRGFFHGKMNNKLYARYIVEEAMEQRHSESYVWHQE